MRLPLSIIWMPSVQRSISETAPLSINFEPFLLHSSDRKPFNCCIDAGLTLELYAILEMNIILMLLFLCLRQISIISLQISLVDLTLLIKSFIPTCMTAVSYVLSSREGVVWRFYCLAFTPGNAFKETSFFMTELYSPIRKFFKMLSIKRTIFLRFLVTTLLKVDCIFFERCFKLMIIPIFMDI